MDIELRLREIHTIHDPGVQVTDAVMARVGERSGSSVLGTGVARLADARERRRRRYILVTMAVAIAAAAAMLLLGPDLEPAPQVAAAPAAIPAVTQPAAPEPAPVVAPPAPDPAPSPVPPEVAAVVVPRDLPLFPPPPRAISATTQDQALQKAVERHPELVEGPDTDSIFHVVLVMRRNGSVINSAARLAQRSELGAVVSELSRLLPGAGSSQTSGSWHKHALLPDGRVLRAEVWFKIGLVADDYDVSRSSEKVEQLVRARYADLLLPSSGTEMNRLTILLTEEGDIEREKVELVRPADERNAARIPEMPRTAAETGQLVEALVATTAERMASRLGIEVDRIGMIGNLRVQEGINGVTEDANGILRPFDQSRSLLVYYVWPRRAGESGPSLEGLGAPAQFAQGLQQELKQTETRLAAAVTIVERLMPDAFTLRNSEAGTPLVALTEKGEVIGAFRLNSRGDEQPGPRAVNKQLQQLDPRFLQGSISKTETLKNEAGATAQVLFAWLPEEPASATNSK